MFNRVYVETIRKLGRRRVSAGGQQSSETIARSISRIGDVLRVEVVDSDGTVLRAYENGEQV